MSETRDIEKWGKKEGAQQGSITEKHYYNT